MIADGIVVLDKPEGISSRKSLDNVMRTLGVRKAGYVGTLDPFATGVLPICLGKATKMIPFIQSQSKKYIATLRLGFETDTWDNTGIIKKKIPFVKCFDEKTINSALERLTGKQNQLTPPFSARKINGVRFYKIARKKIDDVPEKRKIIKIYQLRLLKYDHPDITFEAVCSTGTYIRTLGRDISNLLGTLGTLVYLRRTRVACLSEKDAIPLRDLEMLLHSKGVDSCVFPIEKGVEFLPRSVIKREFQHFIFNGRQTKIDQYEIFPSRVSENELISVFSENGLFMGVVRTHRKSSHIFLKPARIIDIRTEDC